MQIQEKILDNGIFSCITGINGLDGISGSMLKVTANATFPSVTALFKNLSEVE